MLLPLWHPPIAIMMPGFVKKSLYEKRVKGVLSVCFLPLWGERGSSS